MLLKFAYQDFLDDRRFKNTTKTNIKNYEMLLGRFVDYCIENEVVNVEDIAYNHVRQYLLNGQEKGDKAGTLNTKLMKIRAFLNYMVECEVIKCPCVLVNFNVILFKESIFHNTNIYRFDKYAKLNRSLNSFVALAFFVLFKRRNRYE